MKIHRRFLGEGSVTDLSSSVGLDPVSSSQPQTKKLHYAMVEHMRSWGIFLGGHFFSFVVELSTAFGKDNLWGKYCVTPADWWKCFMHYWELDKISCWCPKLSTFHLNLELISLYWAQYWNTFWFLVDKFLSLSGRAKVPRSLWQLRLCSGIQCLVVIKFKMGWNCKIFNLIF